MTGEKQASLPLSEANWSLKIDGEVAESVVLSFADLCALPQDTLCADIHCVTSWSQLGMGFRGIRFSTLLNKGVVQPSSETQFVRFTTYSAQNHDTSLPLDLTMANN